MTDPISSDIPGVHRVDRITESKPVEPSQAPSKAVAPPEGAKPDDNLSQERWNLSSGGREGIQFAKIQYHLAYVVLSALNVLTELTDPTEHLSIPVIAGKVQEIAMVCLTSPSAGNASLDHPPADQSPSARTLSERMVVAAEHSSKGPAAEMESDKPDELTRLLDYFSPENTAQRLLDAAVILFNARETTHPEAAGETRRSFFESIGRAIDEAFKQVLRRAGKLSAAVQGEVGKTQSLIFSGLQTLSEKGIDAERIAPIGSAMEQLDTFCRESIRCFDQLEHIFARSGYDIHGISRLISTETFSRKG